ncbi:ABC transporter-like [Syntrophomonas zehnderi OL-4]|uniref:ABC transporter-like n=1 Tax=Syntrophomonas zehnderi OL-4 TaxID=690567 RepID=A0A0E4C9L0_9FIRM|nr:ABC transporter ATP-binding protein [Syntrophomonas zehnderi]CFY02375.1 ABC transporter-like [Syntrophomonas zehnderi OL-4]
MQKTLLELSDLSIKFGGLTAVNRLNLKINAGEAVGLIGPNGAGKTTAFNLIVGVHQPTVGKVIFDEEDITGLAPHVVCRKGIGRTFQVVKPFGKMTVLQNIMVGAFVNTSKKSEARLIATEIMEKMSLQGKRDYLAQNLTIPERKRLEMAKALATQPKLLLLDEVLAGLNQTEIEEAVQLIKTINRDGITILMIEHVLQATMAICSRIVVLDYGKKIAEGSPQEVTSNSEVIKAYLGDEYENADS